MVETNVHFPTDINLTWDCARKCLDMTRYIVEELGWLPEWRQIKDWRNKLRRNYHQCSEIHRKKGNNYQNRLERSVKKYLNCCLTISQKIDNTLKDKSIGHTITSALLTQELDRYKKLLDKHIDLVERRILKGEKIPHQEKMFSIFEPHTEWLNKGKLHKNCELGLNTLIVTDQHQFILHHEVMQKQVDVHMTIPVSKTISKKYKGYKLTSISFDRNFFSQNAKEVVGKLFENVVLPKPGKKSAQQQEEESSKTFSVLRKQHSAVEANINQLEHNGVNKCPDKGIYGFRRYVALGVIAYNLHHLGKLILKHEKS